jgi:hypothetical protein
MTASAFHRIRGVMRIYTDANCTMISAHDIFTTLNYRFVNGR